jgi:hypothetical protein
MSPELLNVFAQFGPLGLMIAYLMWDKSATEKGRDQVERERTESDKALAAALSALTVTIQHLEQRIK